MINQEILREYDIRGIFQKSLTLEDVKNISYKLATIIKKTNDHKIIIGHDGSCLLYTSPSPRDRG